MTKTWFGKLNVTTEYAGRGRRAPAARKQPIMVRIGAEMIQRIDAAAKRLGISRSAFIVSSTAERLERMEAPPQSRIAEKD